MSTTTDKQNRTAIRSTTSLPCRGCTVRCPNYGRCGQAPWRTQQGSS